MGGMAVIRGCAVEELRPGMRLVEPVTDGCGRMILKPGTELNRRVIEILGRLHIGPVDVVEWREEGMALPQPAVVSEIVDRESSWHPGPFCSIVDPLWDLFREHYDGWLMRLKRQFASLQRESNEAVVWAETEAIVSEITDLSLLAVQVLPCIHFMPRQEGYLVHHSLHVSLLAAMMARLLDWKEEEVKEVALAALLHDVGKLQVPEEILHKTESLTPKEMRVVQGHAVLGFRLLQEAGVFPLSVLAGVLQHHERLDGSGYPISVGQAKMHAYSRVLAIADMYDAMTSKKMYGKQHNPFTAARELRRDMSRDRLDVPATRALLAQIHQFLLGQKVRLDNGSEGWLTQWDESCGENAAVMDKRGRTYLLHDRCGMAIQAIVQPRRQEQWRD
ncbi:HD domain-containing phosphohydrolase [uncultured Anaeromusa sp.]|uniref:HD-GYP domain-containing protein n=1 Tax=uncultured Anaeromusa sp. TaxID=673273 RepID=UPI0029C922BA|nr:HD domain-containing phosphohydrolase [uncultured Anaeromusa sp.]